MEIVDHTMNKYESGYNLLMIISVIDGDFMPQEGSVIVNYLREMHKPFIGTANENPMLEQLSDTQLIEHFRDSSFLFYKQHSAAERKQLFVESAKAYKADSTNEEQKQFIDFLKSIVMADHKVSKEEGQYMNLLFRTWGLK